MRYFQFHSVQNIQIAAKIRRYVLNFKRKLIFGCSSCEQKQDYLFLVILQMMTAHHHKLFLNISHLVCFCFVNNATMTYPYKWAITELLKIIYLSGLLFIKLPLNHLNNFFEASSKLFISPLTSLELVEGVLSSA